MDIKRFGTEILVETEVYVVSSLFGGLAASLGVKKLGVTKAVTFIGLPTYVLTAVGVRRFNKFVASSYAESSKTEPAEDIKTTEDVAEDYVDGIDLDIENDPITDDEEPLA